MGGIREYLIGVVAAALVCGIVTALVNGKTAMGLSVKFISGLLMVLAVIRPLMTISFDGLLGWTEDIRTDGVDYVSSGEMMANEAYRSSIKQQIESYILDEAKSLDCTLSVEVILSDESIPIPKTVKLSGEISPYARQVISNLLAERLGIEREEQIWT